MKYVLIAFLTLGLVGCTSDRPLSKKEFFFKQKVNIISGFYKGYSGTIVSVRSSYSDCYVSYGVYIDDDSEGRVPGEQEICNDRLEVK